MKAAKPYLIAAAAAGGFYLIYRLFRGKRTNAAEQLTVSGEPTKPANWYVVQADALELAMFDVGTNETAIFTIFDELQNDADFEELFNAFGVRTYTGGILPTPWMAGNLVQWLNYELTNSELAQLNEIMRLNGLSLRV